MSDAVRALLAEVRENASPSTWSRGVQMARAEAVVGERDDGDEIVLKVLDDGQRVSPTVNLFVDDAEWACSCRSKADPCEHVAAATIALNQARKAGRELPKPTTRKRTRLRYKLRVEQQRLLLARVTVDERDGSEKSLARSLTAVVTGSAGDAGVVITEGDMKVEAALGTRATPWIPKPRIEAVLRALASCSDVTLDGEPVRVSGEAATPVARLSDAPGGGFRLSLGFGDAESASAIYENGAMLVDGVLRPLGELPLSEHERAALGRGRVFAAGEAAELVSEVLPSLEARVAVERDTRRLPEAQRMSPKLELRSESSGEQLAVRAELVYVRRGGSEIRGRLVGGRLRAEDLDGPLPVRDPMAERRVERAAREQLGLRVGRTNYVHGLAAVELVAKLDGASGRELVARNLGDGRRAFRTRGALVASVQAEDGGFEVSFSAGGRRDADAEADAQRVLSAWAHGEALVPLRGGGWAPLPLDWLEAHGARVAQLLEARDARRMLRPAAKLEALRLLDAIEQPAPADLAPLRALLAPRGPGATTTSADNAASVDGAAGPGAGAAIPPAALPEDLTATLRDYQRRGVDWLCFLREAGMGALLADDMGLGKTLQTLCALRGRSLVVAPASVLSGWLDEAARFRPSLRAARYHGPRRELDDSADLTVTTYGVLRADAEKLAAVRWDCLVLDESQVIKNPDSQVARAAYGLDARFFVALTGTPVENRLADLWSQMHVVNRGLLGGHESFEERYADPIVNGDTRAAGALRQRIRPFVLRRLKREVASELPPRTDTVLRCELGDEERVLYDAVHASTRETVVAQLAAASAGGRGGGVMAALEALLRLRQAACHTGLLPGQQASGSSAKVALLCETLEQVVSAGHKALVFSQWTSLLDLVEPELAALGLSHTRLDGATRDRGAVVADFQRADGPPLMLISLRAGGVGLNLTEADHVFLLDPWWNPAVEDQAADRAHRIGQTRPVIVHRLIAEGTVEERILELSSKKRALAAAALEGGAAATALTREDLLALLA